MCWFKKVPLLVCLDYTRTVFEKSVETDIHSRAEEREEGILLKRSEGPV
jgi:hypothetical protein